MKLLTAVALGIALVCTASCIEVEPQTPPADEADKFVGQYNLSMTWAVTIYSTQNYSYIGTLAVTKTGPTSVYFQANYGDGSYFYTQGEVTGNSVVLNGITTNEPSGKYTTTFSPVALSGNILSFTMYQNGDIYSNGGTYPFHSTAAITATRK